MTAGAPVAEDFQVLRRAATPEDALPAAPWGATLAHEREVRRVAENGGWTVWVAAGDTDVCLGATAPSTGLYGTRCVSPEDAAAGQLFMQLDHRLVGVAPDWARELRVDAPEDEVTPITSNGYSVAVAADTRQITLAGDDRSVELPFDAPPSG